MAPWRPSCTQTYGVPPEMFESLAAEHNLAFDWQGYRQAMEEHGEVSGKLSSPDGHEPTADRFAQAGPPPTEFLGYDTTEAEARDQGHRRRRITCATR